MIRLIVRRFTGKAPMTPATAAKIAQKIKGAESQEECLLVDCEEATLSDEILADLVRASSSRKVKFCGLPRSQQRLVRSIFMQHCQKQIEDPLHDTVEYHDNSVH